MHDHNLLRAIGKADDIDMFLEVSPAADEKGAWPATAHLTARDDLGYVVLDDVPVHLSITPLEGNIRVEGHLIDRHVPALSLARRGRLGLRELESLALPVAMAELAVEAGIDPSALPATIDAEDVSRAAREQEARDWEQDPTRHMMPQEAVLFDDAWYEDAGERDEDLGYMLAFLADANLGKKAASPMVALARDAGTAAVTAHASLPAAIKALMGAGASRLTDRSGHLEVKRRGKDGLSTIAEIKECPRDGLAALDPESAWKRCPSMRLADRLGVSNVPEHVAEAERAKESETTAEQGRGLDELIAVAKGSGLLRD